MKQHGFEGNHTWFGMAEEGRSSQNFPSIELGWAVAATIMTTTSGIKTTTTKDLALTTTGVIY